VSAPSTRSTSSLTSLIISSIERIAALCGGGADLKRKKYVDRLRRPNLTDQLFGNGLDVADQQIAVDLFEWGFVGEWHVKQVEPTRSFGPNAVRSSRAAGAKAVSGIAGSGENCVARLFGHAPNPVEVDADEFTLPFHHLAGDEHVLDVAGVH
jgi:hypothetical protein